MFSDDSEDISTEDDISIRVPPSKKAPSIASRNGYLDNLRNSLPRNEPIPSEILQTQPETFNKTIRDEADQPSEAIYKRVPEDSQVPLNDLEVVVTDQIDPVVERTAQEDTNQPSDTMYERLPEDPQAPPNDLEVVVIGQIAPAVETTAQEDANQPSNTIYKSLLEESQAPSNGVRSAATYRIAPEVESDAQNIRHWDSADGGNYHIWGSRNSISGREYLIYDESQPEIDRIRLVHKNAQDIDGKFYSSRFASHIILRAEQYH
jgi:hypothetical protein